MIIKILGYVNEKLETLEFIMRRKLNKLKKQNDKENEGNEGLECLIDL